MESITYSSIRSFLNCRRKFYYQYIRKLKPIDKPTYFYVGSAVHEALECWYKTKQHEKAVSKIDIYFRERLPSSDEKNYEEKLQESGESHEKSIRIFERYLNNYDGDRKLKIIETEKELSLNAREIGIEIDRLQIKLKVDAIIEKDGIRYLMEHKTAAGIDELYKKKLIVDLQSMFYIICLNALGHNVKGVCYNVIKTKLPAKPELTKTGKLSTAKNRKPDLAEYIKAIEDNNLNQSDYEDHLEWLRVNQSESFYREYIIYHDAQFEKLLAELNYIANDIVNETIGHEKIVMNEVGFYKNTSNCIGFGTCPFFDVCVALYPESVIENTFVEKADLHEEYKTN